MINISKLALAISIATTLSACGGGSNGDSSQTTPHVQENIQHIDTSIENENDVINDDYIEKVIDTVVDSEIETEQTANPNQWREDYLNETEQTLRDAMGNDFPEVTYNWVIEKGFRNSLLQAVGPDPKILLNLDAVLNDLHPATADKYANMIFAITVARRVDGIGSVTYNSDRFAKPASVENEAAPLSAREQKNQDETMLIVNSLNEYLNEKSWDTTTAFEHSNEVLAHLDSFSNLAKNKYDSPIKLATMLKQVNIENGLIKPRDKNATVVEYINHIERIQSVHVDPFIAKKGEYIPGTEIFPHNAPWPLLMPLAEGRPLSEMEWIFDRFSDESENPFHRMRKYGYYNRADARAPLVASTLFPSDSLQEINEVGGLCGTMSQVGRGSYISMGVPSMGSGQPGHANLVRYKFNSNNSTYTANIEQSIASLYDTTPDWYFFEEDSARIEKGGRVSHGEYVYGLSIAMNYDLQDYLDSRTLVRMASTLDYAENEEKQTLLNLAIEKSPFNAEAWYDLYDITGKTLSDAMSMTNKIRSILPLNSESDEVIPEGQADEDLDEQAEIIVGLEHSTAFYRDTIIAQFLELAWNNTNAFPTDYEAFINNENSVNKYILTRYFSQNDYDEAQLISKGKLYVQK